MPKKGTPKKETPKKETPKKENPKTEAQNKEMNKSKTEKKESPKKEVEPQNKGVDVEKKDCSGNTPLHLAAQAGHLQSARNLLIYTVAMNVNVKNGNGETPLHLAAEGGHMDVVILLLDSGADPSIQDNNGATPCHLAASQGHVEIMEIMTKRSDIRKGIKKLHEAAEKGFIRHLKKLLESQLPLDERNERGETALYVAALKGHLECCEMLLDAGADPNIVTGEGSTVLHAAAKSGLASIIEKICTNTKNVKPNEHQKPSDQKSKTTGKFDDPIADKDKREQPGTSTNKSPSKEWQDIYKKCENMSLSDSDSEDDKDKRGEYQLPAIEDYLKALFSTDTKEDLERQRVFLREMLADLSERMNVDTNLGNKANLLHLAAACRVEDTVRVLLKRKADVNARTKDGVTPLMMACSGGSMEVVKVLVEAGSDPKVVDKRRRSALHYAVRVRSLDVTQYLLTLGLDPNAKDAMGNTPLHIASLFDAGAEVINALIEAGGDLFMQNRDYLFPFSLASNAVTFRLLQPQGGANMKNRVRVFYDPNPTSLPLELNLGRKPIKSGASSDKGATEVDVSEEASGSKTEESLIATPTQSEPHHKKTKRGGRKHKKKYVEPEVKPVQTVRPDKITDLYLRIMTQYPDDVEDRLRDYFMEGRFDEINCSVIDTNRTDKAGLTILHHAVRCCRFLAVQRLVVKCKANVNAETFRGVTPMFFAATTGYMDVIRILYENGANLNHMLKCGMTPLHYAVVHKNLNSVRTLCYLGANLDSPDQHGNTPLHYASMTPGNLKVVQTLIEKGADPQFVNTDGLRALEIAKRAGDVDIIRYLIQVTEFPRDVTLGSEFVRVSTRIVSLEYPWISSQLDFIFEV